mmetsp:Transcript_27349/g.57301  ORF Transcript_27349/g.57301 Transcript_27349/m.57301 type:complete len:114 (-) Transcript_27349:190-531(-)
MEFKRFSQRGDIFDVASSAIHKSQLWIDQHPTCKMGNTEEAFAFIQSPSAIIVDIRFFYLREQRKPFSIQQTQEQEQQIKFTILFFFFPGMVNGSISFRISSICRNEQYSSIL